ncbi:transposase [Streptomyces sp.]|uniref:transposase n=1 Tax=Streptomyces sp. TaxID=1931 RepID=UPI002810FE7A|nr:transposase [Streptomyces sp.]
MFSRHAARQDWEKTAKALRPVCTAPAEEAALERFMEFTDAWGGKHPAIVRRREAAWGEFVPFLRFDVEMQDRLHHQRDREHRRTDPRGRPGPGPLPHRPAALTCVHPAVMCPGPTGTGRKRRTVHRKAALQAFGIAFDGRLTAGRR